MTHVTSTHVSLAKGSPVTLPEFKTVRKSGSTTCLEVGELNIYEQTQRGLRPLRCSELHEERTLSYSSGNPGTGHRDCHTEAVLGVCVQWTTEFIMSCQLFISTAQASGAWVIIIFLAQHMAKCLALSRCSLRIYQRGEYGISDRFYRLTIWLLFLFTWLGVT